MASNGNITALGVDLLQPVAMVARIPASSPLLDTVLVRNPFDGLPSAVLPMYPHESGIYGDAATLHRRGSGSFWPEEMQAPFCGDAKRGVGKVPLICAWERLIPKTMGTGSWEIFKPAETDITWYPSTTTPVSISSECLIAESIKSTAMLHKHNGPLAVVVPDCLGEAAQQALLDALQSIRLPDVLLLPQPVAVAVKWCAVHAKQFQHVGNASEEGVPVGHLRILTLSLTMWETAVFAIHARTFDGKTWLVPVRKRPAAGYELPCWGWGILASTAVAASKNTSEAWRMLCSDDWFYKSYLFNRKPFDRTVLMEAMSREGGSTALRRMFKDWPIFKSYLNRNVHGVSGGLLFLDKISERVQAQVNDLPQEASTCLGIVVSGGFAHEHLFEGNLMAQIGIRMRCKNAGTFPIEIATAAEGAAIAAYVLQKGCPCYRDTLVGLDIYCHKRTETRDLMESWRPLVEARTVEAGQIYRPPEPISGLKISAGNKSLSLMLRRKIGTEYEYRRVITNQIVSRDQDEPILLNVAIRPGQGFAKVNVESMNPGVFTTLLNWRTMEPCDKPPPPTLAYIPKVSQVIADPGLWRQAEHAIELAIRALRSPHSVMYMEQIKILTRQINKMPLAIDNENCRQGDEPKKDYYKHYGVFGSDGKLSSTGNPGLARQLRQELEQNFVNQRSFEMRNAVQRSSSWMYLAVPKSILEFVRKSFKAYVADTGDCVSAIDIQVAGLCFDSQSDIKLFFKALAKTSDTRGAVNYNWLRGLRDIIRFREHALCLETVGVDDLYQILETIMQIIEDETNHGNFKRIFESSIYAVTILLKRRRYDPNFLAIDDQLTMDLNVLLKKIKKVNRNEYWRPQPTERQNKLIDATLKFLFKTATEEDVPAPPEDDE